MTIARLEKWGRSNDDYDDERTISLFSAITLLIVFLLSENGKNYNTETLSDSDLFVKQWQ